jgi:arsenite oxidase small subunit|tara:strand:- start:453 stop:1079 length:627 start_codon:yes stop_codon:yes gene_type:complete
MQIRPVLSRWRDHKNKLRKLFDMKNKEKQHEGVVPCVTRRRFLMASGGVTATSMILSALPGMVGELRAEVVDYPRKKIAQLSDLKPDTQVHFNYPDKDPLHSFSFLVKLGTPAGGGIGPDRDVVAFSALCSHMGGILMGIYQKSDKIAGPCPLHLTTFDLTKHGMVVAGHATESLPQVVLDLDGDDIYATGILGLIYGKRDNLDPSSA